MNDKDKALLEALRKWRLRKFNSFNEGEPLIGDTHDPRSFMPNEVVLRVIALAHHRLFDTKEALVRDVVWPWIDDYAPDLLSIMHQTHPPRPSSPPEPSVPAPLQPPLVQNTMLAPVAVNAASGLKRQNRCGLCGHNGHNRRTCRESIQYYQAFGLAN